jgi:hypothetical protein
LGAVVSDRFVECVEHSRYPEWIAVFLRKRVSRTSFQHVAESRNAPCGPVLWHPVVIWPRGAFAIESNQK